MAGAWDTASITSSRTTRATAGLYPPRKEERALCSLHRLRGAKERLGYLAGFGGMQCGEWSEYYRQLRPLYEAIYDEANRIGVSREEKELVILNLRDLEEMRIGSEAAYRNWRKRRELLQ